MKPYPPLGILYICAHFAKRVCRLKSSIQRFPTASNCSMSSGKVLHRFWAYTQI